VNRFPWSTFARCQGAIGLIALLVSARGRI
jgi:hypothetical protein